MEAAYDKKQAEEIRTSIQNQNTQKVQILKKEVVTPVQQKEKTFMYVLEKASEQEDAEVLMKSFATGEPVQKQVRFEEGLVKFKTKGKC